MNLHEFCIAQSFVCGNSPLRILIPEKTNKQTNKQTKNNKNPLHNLISVHLYHKTRKACNYGYKKSLLNSVTMIIISTKLSALKIYDIVHVVTSLLSISAVIHQGSVPVIQA